MDCSDLNILPLQLGNIYHPISVDVIHSEGPSDFLLLSSTRGHMQGQHELPEVDGSTSISVKCPKHVLCKFLRISPGKYLAVDFNKMFLGQLPVGAILQEPFVPFLRLIPGVIKQFGVVGCRNFWEKFREAPCLRLNLFRHIITLKMFRR